MLIEGKVKIKATAPRSGRTGMLAASQPPLPVSPSRRLACAGSSCLEPLAIITVG